MQDWKRVAELFDRALELPPTQRERFLERECHGDAGLLREVRELLLYEVRSGDFLKGSALEAEARRLTRGVEGVLIGECLSHYRILEELGRGGMGIVYRVEDTRSKEIRVLKVLFPVLALDSLYVRRFKREARAASTLNHPGINRILETGEVEGLHFMVMDYVEGMPLSALTGTPLDPGRAVKIVMALAEALEAAHRKGIVHRDIKPSNIMITSDGQVKILDFGIAKSVGPAALGTSISTTSLTASDTIVGTLDYMSPEQLRGQPVDNRSDIFSLGAVFYEMLSGVHPFRTGRPLETSANILSLHPPPVARYSPSSPEALREILQKMLAKDRRKRYTSMKLLQRDLRAVLEGRRDLADDLRSRRILWLVVLVVALVTLALILSRTLAFQG